MADVEEETPLHKESDSKAQFVNGGKELQAARECGSGDGMSLKKKRQIYLIVCLTIIKVVAAIVIIVQASKRTDQGDQKWYNKDTVYEILPESFQDSNLKAEKNATLGDGVGDINGICLLSIVFS